MASSMGESVDTPPVTLLARGFYCLETYVSQPRPPRNPLLPKHLPDKPDHITVSKYVRYMREHAGVKNILHASVEHDDVRNCYSRFLVEPSKKYEEEGLVHIQCCYNKKYWIPRPINTYHGDWYISCDADEPGEDKSELSTCTLFKPDKHMRWSLTYGGTSSLVGTYITVPSITNPPEKFECCLLLHRRTSLPVKLRVAAPIIPWDLGKHKALPKRVRFKGDNGKYLGTFEHGGNTKLKFGWTDAGEANVTYIIGDHFQHNNISVRQHANNKDGKFWRVAEDGSIFVDSDTDSAVSKEQQKPFRFEVVRLGANAVALKNVSNSKYVRRLANDDDCLAAWDDTITELARLRIEEAVLCRRVYNVEYRQDEARIYDVKDLVLASAHAENHGSTPNTAKLNLKYTVTSENTWASSSTGTWGVNASIEAGVPKLLEKIGIDFKINLGIHYDQEYTVENGGSNSRTEERSVDYDITIPPNTKVTLRATASQARCDIPYTYYQEDLLPNGDKLTRVLEDGIYQGVDNYSFTYQVTEEKLPVKQQDAVNKDDDGPAGESSGKKRKQGEVDGSSAMESAH